jgi:hypothetical protein
LDGVLDAVCVTVADRVPDCDGDAPKENDDVAVPVTVAVVDGVDDLVAVVDGVDDLVGDVVRDGDAVDDSDEPADGVPEFDDVALGDARTAP